MLSWLGMVPRRRDMLGGGIRYGVMFTAVNALLATVWFSDSPAQTLGRETRLLRVERSGRPPMIVQVQWVANLKVEKSERGASANVLALKFQDNRACEWSVWSELQRRIVILEGVDVTILGAVERDVSKVIEGTRLEQRATGKQCEEATTGLERDLEIVKTRTAAAFPQLVAADLREFEERLRRSQRTEIREVSKTETAPSVRDDQDIREVLSKYKQALEERNVELFRSVYPELTGSKLDSVRSSFARSQARTVELKIEAIAVLGNQAEAKGQRYDVLVSKDGQRLENRAPFVFRLKRCEPPTQKCPDGVGWLINSIN